MVSFLNKHRYGLLSVAVVFCATATAHALQTVVPPATTSPVDVNWLGKLDEGKQVIASVIAAVWGLFTALAALCGFLGALFGSAWLTKAGAWFGRWSIPIHEVAGKVGMFGRNGGGPPPGAAGGAAAVLLIVGCAWFGASGCSLFQPNPSNDPSIYATDVQEVAGAINDTVKLAFPVLLPLLSPSQQFVAQAKFDQAETAFADANAGIDALKSAYHAGKSGDWTAAVVALKNAVLAVVAVYDVFANPATGAALGGVGPHIGSDLTAKRAVVAKQLDVLAHYH